MKHEYGDMGDELLNAYLDEQLDSDERGRVLEALRHDRQLAERVCALRQVKELTRHAYDDVAPDAAGGRDGRTGRPGWWAAAAALSLLVAGAATGWWGHQQWPQGPAQARMLQLQDAAPARLLAAAEASKRVILHISSNEPQRLATALDTVGQLLETSQLKRDDLQVEVIVNSDGLDLLRTETSAHSARIRALASRFHNVHFLACSKAVERLQREGVDVKLLPEAKVSGPALEVILKRMREGWLYIEA